MFLIHKLLRRPGLSTGTINSILGKIKYPSKEGGIILITPNRLSSESSTVHSFTKSIRGEAAPEGGWVGREAGVLGSMPGSVGGAGG